MQAAAPTFGPVMSRLDGFASNAAGQRDAQQQDSAATGGMCTRWLRGLLPGAAVCANISPQLRARLPAQQTQSQAQAKLHAQAKRARASGGQGEGSSRASGQQCYGEKIADATNLFSAIGYTYLRALNNAGHDIMEGFQGLYTPATDADARGWLARIVGQAMEYPADTAAHLCNADKDYVNNACFEKKDEDTLRVVAAGGLASAGVGGKAALGTGQVVKGTAATFGLRVSCKPERACEIDGADFSNGPVRLKGYFQTMPNYFQEHGL